jgi:transcriptional regulator with XRE-family HTH domain
MSDALADRVRLRIRIEMAKRDLNTTKLAGLLGVSDMWLSRRLRGKTELHLGDLERLAKALDMDPDDLLEPAA